MLLAIDTSVGSSVAVVDAGQVRAEFVEPDTRHHAELIGVLIERALHVAGVTPVQLDAVAAGMGPGPFTGLRVGIAAAHAFAVGAGLAVLPVVSHDAIALAEWRSDDGGGSLPGAPSPQLLVTTDARRREVYWSRYDRLDGHGLPVRVAGPELTKPDEVTSCQLNGGALALCRVDARTVSAAALGIIADRRARLGLAPEADAALYLRSPDITPSAGLKRVSG